jgi:hypothetical protein
MEQRTKFDPLAYLLLCSVIGLQVYTSFLRSNDAERLIEESDRIYKTAVFESADNNGIMQQIFRQNEVDRELLKALLHRCAR